MSQKIGIIGAGVVGTAMGVVLGAQDYDVIGIHDVKPDKASLSATRVGCRVYSDPGELSRLTDILFITSNDSAIESIVDNLAESQSFHPGQTIVHMSGAQSSQVLDKAKEFGARALSLHPLQSFANLEGAVANIPGSVFSIEGDQDAYNMAIQMVEALGGEYFFIDRDAKPLYHAGACVVSNYLVTLLDLGAKLLESAGIPVSVGSHALLPLVYGTLRNIERIGIPAALTGPIARGDISTVARHLECINDVAPELDKLYRTLGYYTVPIAEAKGTIGETSKQEFQKLFMGTR